MKSRQILSRAFAAGVATSAVALPLGALLFVPATVAWAQLEESLATHFDIFIGKNTPGPYTLSWTNIQMGRNIKFEVIVDGQTLKPESYTVDPVKGIISFGTPLAAKSVARITYVIDPGTAKRNPNASTSPLTLPVTRFGENTLSVVALPNGDPSKAGSTPLVWSFGGKTNLLGGGVSTEFKSAGEDKSGVKLGFNRGNDRNGIDLQFARADKQFATAVGKVLGMGDATQRTALATRLAPSKYLRTNYSQTESINLLTNEHKDQDIYGLQLGGIGKQPKVNFTRTDDTTLAPDRRETNVLTDKVDIAARLDKMTAVNATTTQSATNTPDPNADAMAKDTTITLTSAANGGAKQATATVNEGSKEMKGSVEEKKGVSVRLQPGPIFIVSAAQNEQKVTPVKPDGTSGAPTTVVTQTAGAEIVPVKNAKVTSSISETTNNNVTVSATNFGAQLGMGQPIEITGGITNRSSEAAGKSPLDTTRAQIALRPIKTLTLTGAYTWNPEDNGAVRQALRQELGLTATVGAISLGSTYMLTTINGVSGADDPDPQFGLVSLSLGMRFDRYTNLTGTYKDSLRYRSATALAPSLCPQYLRSYGLGLTHNLGSALNLSLGGSMTEDRSKGDQAKDIKGEAKIGIHF